MSEKETSRNSRIAKNTFLLYVRMILVMLVSLYTSRILLEALGISDYGIYNVVGGVVTMFTFMSAALGNASSRFITFALGQDNPERTRQVFNAARIIHILIALVIVIFAETIGLWFLNTKMDIPSQSMFAANWVYQFSIVTTAIAIVSVPYNAAIIAHENMNVYAYVSIIDVVFKLGIVFVIKSFGGDRLILYGFLIMCVQFIDRIIYGIYCAKNYPESRFLLCRDKSLYKEMLGFSGWSLIGNLSVFGTTQGLNILLNIFFGPVVNAARGIAVQVQGAIKGFITNFQLAVSPQITKSYASNEVGRVINLWFSSSKLSYFLMLCFAIPLFIEIKEILSIWLVEVPEYTASFVRLMIILIMVDTIERPMTYVLNATGKIRTYQLTSCVCLLLTLPASYLLLRIGLAPQSVFMTNIVMSTIAVIIELVILKQLISFSIREYVYNVVLNIIIVSLVASIIPVVLYLILPPSILSSAIVILLGFISAIITSYLVGLNKTERKFVNEKLRFVFSKLHK